MGILQNKQTVLAIAYLLALLILFFFSRNSLHKMFLQALELFKTTDASLPLLGLMIWLAIAVWVFIPKILPDYALNAWTEFLGIVVGVVIIDRLRAQGAKQQELAIANKAKEQYKQSLIHRAGGKSNETAKSAIDELRKTGWLIDGNCLKGQDLRGANLQGADLSKVDLSGANLTDAILDEANLTGSILIGATLVSTKFRNAQMEGINLSRANIEGAIFNDADLKNADFGSADENTKTENVQLASFVRAKLHSVKFIRFKNLAASKFSQAELNFADFSGAYLVSANFDSANLENAVFNNAQLGKSTFSSAKCFNVSFENCTMNRAKLFGTKLINAKMKGAHLKRTYIDKNTTFERAELWDVDFSGTKVLGDEWQDDSEDETDSRDLSRVSWLEFRNELEKQFSEIKRILQEDRTSEVRTDTSTNINLPFDGVTSFKGATLPNEKPWTKDNLIEYYKAEFHIDKGLDDITLYEDDDDGLSNNFSIEKED